MLADDKSEAKTKCQSRCSVSIRASFANQTIKHSENVNLCQGSSCMLTSMIVSYWTFPQLSSPRQYMYHCTKISYSSYSTVQMQC